MPRNPLPSTCAGNPQRFILEAGTKLFRVHSEHFEAKSFNPTQADAHWGGGRFDATAEDSYSYLYAGEDSDCAVAEALLRDLTLEPSGRFLLPRIVLRGRKISVISPRSELELLCLRSGRDLAAVCQDAWLTTSDSSDYGMTRRWAHKIRGWVPWAQGFVWHSRRDPEKLSYIFFEDRGADVFEELTDPRFPAPDDNRLDGGVGEIFLRQTLAGYNLTLDR